MEGVEAGVRLVPCYCHVPGHMCRTSCSLFAPRRSNCFFFSSMSLSKSGASHDRRRSEDEYAVDPVSLEPLPGSLSGKLPSGKEGQCAHKFRMTVNAYTGAVAELHWHSNSKQDTLKVLERRIGNREHNIRLLDDIEFQNIYDQIRERAKALVALHQAITKWTQLCEDGPLLKIHSVFGTVDAYLAAVSLTLAPDLGILRFFSRFEKEV